jgi:hypothetical protein
MGVPAIPVAPLAKTPPVVAWKRHQAELPTDRELRRYFLGTRHNIAIVCKGLVGFDIDDVTKAELVLQHCGATPVRNRTPSGGEHWIYGAVPGEAGQNMIDVHGVQIDVRFDVKGLLLIPPSELPHGKYVSLGTPIHEIGSVEALPAASIAWARTRTGREVSRDVMVLPNDPALAYKRARGWIAHVEGTITGQGGCHRRAFRVACRLTHYPTVIEPNKGFGLDRAEALQLMLWWNEACDPPLSLREIEHKIDGAIAKR